MTSRIATVIVPKVSVEVHVAARSEDGETEEKMEEVEEERVVRGRLRSDELGEHYAVWEEPAPSRL